MPIDCNSKDVVFAGFWVRLAAFLIDKLILGAVLLLVRLVMMIVMMVLKNTPLSGQLLFSFSLKDIVIYLCGALYFVLCTYYTGATPGKRLMNLRVVSADGQETLSFINILYRETVGRFLSGLVASIGYLLIALDREKRGLHDILCDTRVIYATKLKVYPNYQEPLPAQPQPAGLTPAEKPDSPLPESIMPEPEAVEENSADQVDIHQQDLS